MLTLYPQNGWNTFIDEVTAEAFIKSMTDGTKWDSLTLDERERLMISAAMLISSISDLNGNCSFENAQAMLIMFDLENDGKYLSFVATSGGELKKAKVGPLDVEYNLAKGGAGLGGGVAGLPDVIKSLLADCLLDGSIGARGFVLG